MCRYEKAEIQFPKKKAGTLYIMTDGAAVNTRQKDSSGSSWRENKLGLVFSSDHIYHWTSARGTHEHKILKREYISLIGTSDVFKKHLLALVVRNGYGEYDHTIILSDGATWIHNICVNLYNIPTSPTGTTLIIRNIPGKAFGLGVGLLKAATRLYCRAG